VPVLGKNKEILLLDIFVNGIWQGSRNSIEGCLQELNNKGLIERKEGLI
jgi:hypothetical protein